MAKKKFTYKDKAEVIDRELEKRKGKWFLNSLNWFDFDDVCQIIRSHIHNKWDQWDQDRAIEPWVNKIISNQMKNILRNHYGNFSRPCLGCPFNSSEGQSGPPNSRADSFSDELCGFTSSGVQCNECPLYAKWEKTKKAAYEIKMPLAMEYHSNEASQISSNYSFNLNENIQKVNDEMEKLLSEKQYEIYKMLFIENTTEEKVAEKMGYKTSEKGRKAGYKQIKNLKKLFKEKVQTILKKKDIFYGE
jgi:RNA polymerase sigma factor (sigma-70 family)